MIEWRGAARGAAAVLAAVLLTVSAVRSQGLSAITVGCTNVDDSTTVLYAVQAGLFRRAGLDVKVERTASGSAAAAGILGGTFAFANSSVMAPITAHVRGVPLLIAAPGGLYVGQDFVEALVKKDSPIASARDLDNAVIASVSVNDLLAMALQAWMDQHGGNSHTVRNVEMPYSAMVPALQDGRVAVAVMLQPQLGQARAGGQVRTLAKPFDAIAKRFLISGWLTSGSYAEAHPDVVRSFARVVREAAAYANAHQTDTAPIIAAFTGVDVQSVLRSGRSVYEEGPPDPREVQPVVDVAVKYKAVDKTFDARELFSPAVMTGGSQR